MHLFSDFFFFFVMKECKIYKKEKKILHLQTLPFVYICNGNTWRQIKKTKNKKKNTKTQNKGIFPIFFFFFDKYFSLFKFFKKNDKAFGLKFFLFSNESKIIIVFFFFSNSMRNVWHKALIFTEIRSFLVDKIASSTAHYISPKIFLIFWKDIIISND